jgi:membrane associated rhomboid family serine protease
MDFFDQLLHAQVTLILLAVTTAVSIFAFNNPRLRDALMLDVGAIKQRGEVWRMATAGFVHGDPAHLFFNMLTLLFFGPPLEIGVGRVDYAILYFGSLLGGSALSVLENWRKRDYRALGASGAIAGLTVCFSVFAPMAMIGLFFVLPVPAIVYSIGFIAFSWYASTRFGDSGIGHTGHLGGALAGLAITCILFPAIVRALPETLARGFPPLF